MFIEPISQETCFKLNVRRSRVMISTGDWVDGSPSLFKIVFLERKKEKKRKKKTKNVMTREKLTNELIKNT